MSIVTSRGVINAGSLGKVPTEKGGEIQFGGVKREPVMGSEGVVGHSEDPVAPYIKVTLLNVNSVDKEKLSQMVNETITYSLNSGETYTLTNAFVSDPTNIQVDGGKIDVQFFGDNLI
ncbi:MAG: hypothetical protein DSZ27_07250 [Thiomicrospira sp.]|nr:MAG: hypothetical protein DSZ27_07250 [Thiomicrospira sp.]